MDYCSFQSVRICKQKSYILGIGAFLHQGSIILENEEKAVELVLK